MMLSSNPKPAYLKGLAMSATSLKPLLEPSEISVQELAPRSSWMLGHISADTEVKEIVSTSAKGQVRTGGVPGNGRRAATWSFFTPAPRVARGHIRANKKGRS